ncbi:hypothetical protein [Roseomonas marmotae]|uniref:Uncharacterized protein n=1 Tax=Roseomonas marmotae TaxID=2768161 RepID=A0ABS3K917_9PROT|nr:hypothetical protein [Roseomonas marmotae]MBO1073964.1 hypothetical protein [Roseomonas marmotae]QTI78757.1 hypothetical protein IAI58_13995 [Roseomonas marmotae]
MLSAVLTSARESLLETSLSRLLGWDLAARCLDPCCPPNRPIPVQEILVAQGDVTLAHSFPRLRCSACGGAAVGMALQRKLPGGTVSRRLLTRPSLPQDMS